MKGDSEYGEKDMEEVQGMLRSASRDCVLKERNSFVTLQAKTGVEVSRFLCDYVAFCFISWFNKVILDAYANTFKIPFTLMKRLSFPGMYLSPDKTLYNVLNMVLGMRFKWEELTVS